jgi:hypothetical protein
LKKNFIKFLQIFLSVKAIQRLIKKSNLFDFYAKLDWSIYDRTHYMYGLYHSALQAKALNINKISAIEFGVAGGNGLVKLEEYSKIVANETGVEIDTYGFDMGSGMPEPLDYRDLMYIWKPGFFKMDLDALNSKLSKSKLILGNVKETVLNFIEENKPAPIGFISFDLDYYSSTKDAFKLFDTEDKYLLPRIFCYFDDMIGDDWELHNEFTGEYAAILEYNEKNAQQKITKIHGLFHKRRIIEPWNDKMFVHHRFNHKLYNEHIYPDKDWHLKLK